jgi:hypothetical protein
VFPSEACPAGTIKIRKLRKALVLLGFSPDGRAFYDLRNLSALPEEHRLVGGHAVFSVTSDTTRPVEGHCTAI